MKHSKVFLFLFILILPYLISSLEGNEKPLSDLYKSGKVRFVPELVIDDNSMPDGVFFERPSDIACDNKGNIYISDYKADNIRKFDSTGKYLFTIGERGQGPGDFYKPMLLTIAKDHLVVWDMGNRRLCTLTTEGKFLKSIQIYTRDGWPTKLRSLPSGDIVIEKFKVHFREENRPQDCNIDIYSPDLEFKDTLYSRKIWSDKYITKPIRTNVPQPFSPRVFWDTSKDGKIVIGFSKKYDIEIYDMKGERISAFTHSYEPVKVTEEDKKVFFSGLVGRASGGQAATKRQGAPDYIRENTEFPRFKPAFNNIMIDSEGNILVCIFRKKKSEESRYFDAFDSKGNYLGKVKIVGEISFPARPVRNSIDNSFWKQAVEPDGTFKIIKYKISD